MATGKPLKIVEIGCGTCFGRGTVADIMGNPAFNDLDTTLVLVDTSPTRLETMRQFAALLKAHFKSNVKVETTCKREEALEGADFVVSAIAIQRYPLWEQDYRVPVSFGFKHALGENGGPGALFHALRNLRIVMPIARDMERLCPDTVFLNFTNPENRMIMALSKLTKLKAYGLCHGAIWAKDHIAKILGRPMDQLDVQSGGLNHFFHVFKIADKMTGEDLYPEFREKALSCTDHELIPPMVKKMLEIYDSYGIPSEDHSGEYLAYAHEFTGLRWPYGRESRPHVRPTSDKPQLDPLMDFTDTTLEAYISGEKPLDGPATVGSGENAIPVILGMALDLNTWIDSVNLVNDGLYIENMYKDAIVEVPATINKTGICPQKMGPLPEAWAAHSNLQVSIQKLMVEAFDKQSKKLLLQALLLDPVVDSLCRAEQMLDYMLELQKEYLPKFE